MQNVYYLLKLEKLLLFTLCSIVIVLLSSCDKEDMEDEVIDLHKREGSIRFYTNRTEIIYTDIVEYPFVKLSINSVGYDTIGVAYTGYPEPHSIIGSLNLIILFDNLQLNYVEYRYRISDGAAVSFARWDSDVEEINPLLSHVEETEDGMRGSFSGDLYPGGSYYDEVEPIVIDSCFFYIYSRRS